MNWWRGILYGVRAIGVRPIGEGQSLPAKAKVPKPNRKANPQDFKRSVIAFAPFRHGVCLRFDKIVEPDRLRIFWSKPAVVAPLAVRMPAGIAPSPDGAAHWKNERLLTLTSCQAPDAVRLKETVDDRVET